MKEKYFAYFLGLVLMLVLSCGHIETKKDLREADNRVLQQADGVVSLKLDKAGCYCDKSNPSNNTAEWNVVISKAGSYKVWLSSATRDTINLNYKNTVKVNVSDSQLVVIPVCDKIIRNSEDVSYPYYRADSYMGSYYVSEPGIYNIQVISEKVISKASENQAMLPSDNSKLIAVILTPLTR